MSDSIEIEEIVGETGKQHFHMDTKVGSDHQMTGAEDALTHGSFAAGRPLFPLNRWVAVFIFIPVNLNSG